MLGLTIVAAAIAIYAAFQSRLGTTILGGPLIFVTLGLVLSNEGLGVLDLDLDTGTVTILLKATLVILLFTEASELEPRRMRGEISIPGRLLGLGMPLVMILGTVAAALLFDGIGIWEAAVVAALLAPTDAALGVPVVSNKRVPERIRRSLIVESGLNDGLAVPFAFAFAAAGEVFTSDATGADAFTFLVEQIGFGLVVGIIVGAVGAKILKETSDSRVGFECFGPDRLHCVGWFGVRRCRVDSWERIHQCLGRRSGIRVNRKGHNPPAGVRRQIGRASYIGKLPRVRRCNARPGLVKGRGKLACLWSGKPCAHPTRICRPLDDREWPSTAHSRVYGLVRTPRTRLAHTCFSCAQGFHT